MSELLKCLLVILISVTLSMQWCNHHFEKIKLPYKTEVLLVKTNTPLKIVVLTNWVTVTNIVEVPIQTNKLISPGIPLPIDTQTVSSIDIKPPVENETRLRQLAKELTELLDGIKIKE